MYRILTEPVNNLIRQQVSQNMILISLFCFSSQTEIISKILNWKGGDAEGRERRPDFHRRSDKRGCQSCLRGQRPSWVSIELIYPLTWSQHASITATATIINCQLFELSHYWFYFRPIKRLKTLERVDFIPLSSVLLKRWRKESANSWNIQFYFDVSKLSVANLWMPIEFIYLQAIKWVYLRFIFESRYLSKLRRKRAHALVIWRSLHINNCW